MKTVKCVFLLPWMPLHIHGINRVDRVESVSIDLYRSSACLRLFIHFSHVNYLKTTTLVICPQ